MITVSKREYIYEFTEHLKIIIKRPVKNTQKQSVGISHDSKIQTARPSDLIFNIYFRCISVPLPVVFVHGRSWLLFILTRIYRLNAN